MMNSQLQSWEGAKPISARDVLRILWRRLWIILLVVATSLAISTYVSRHTPKRWQAQAALILVQRAATLAPSTEASYTAPMVESVDTQVALLQSMEMAERTLDWLKNKALAQGRSADDLSLSPDELQKQILVFNPKDT
ncbi:MAG TPA: Wzz/FepE/Etk N-terminal domain-containing protein, partial [Chthonomonadaceae bacterium]|nr:Wzz/FepE/Etk N-terminal domain-containing protein [Chthonomonadaceae bacterium]